MRNTTLSTQPPPPEERSLHQTERPSILKESLPFIITLAAGFLFYGLFFKRNLWLSVIGYSIAPAERVMQGEVPYRDFLYNYTPGMLWLNALLMKTFGATIETVRYGLFAFKLATLVALLHVARRLIGAWAALIPVALALGWIGYKYVFGVFPTQYSMLFVLLGLGCILNYDRAEKHGWLALGGLSVGMVFIFKYNVGILLLATGTAALSMREAMLSGAAGGWSRRAIASAKKIAIYWAGFALAACAMAAYVAYDHALWNMIDHFFHHATAYGQERAIPLPHVKLLAPVALATLIAVIGGWVILKRAARFFESYLIALILLGSIALLIPVRGYYIKVSASATVAYMPIMLFAIAAGLAVWQLKTIFRNDEERKAWWHRNGAIVLLTMFAMGAYMEVYPRADYYHLVRALPPVFLLLVALIARAIPTLRKYLQNHLASSNRVTLLCAAVPLVLLLMVAVKDVWGPSFDSRMRFADRVPLAIERAQGIMVRPKQAEMIEGLARLIEDNSSADDHIFSFAQRGTGFYFLTGRKNPTRFVWWRSVGLKQEDRAAVLGMIAERKPKLILLQDGLKNRQVRQQIAAGYHKIGAVNDIAVYDRKRPENSLEE